jgi:P4 family phage/plasmid primase-like protien
MNTILSLYKTQDKTLQTHTFFGNIKQKLSIPNEKNLEFMVHYHYLIENNIPVCITEKSRDTFKFFADIDLDEVVFRQGYLIKDTIPDFIDKVKETFQDVIKDAFGLQLEAVLAYRLAYKCHIHFKDLITDKESAKLICNDVYKRLLVLFPWIQELKTIHTKNVIDTSVYTSGLRMLGSDKGSMISKEKKEHEKRVHLELFGDSLLYKTFYTIEGKDVVSLQDIIDYSIINMDDIIPQMFLLNYTRVQETRKRRLVIEEMDIEESEELEIPLEIKKTVIEYLDTSLIKFGLLPPISMNVVKKLNDIIQVTLPPQVCPFKKSMHNRTQTRNVSANYVLITAFGTNVHCWKCTDETQTLSIIPDDLANYLEDSCPNFLLKRALYKQTHELLADYIFSKTREKFAVSMGNSNYVWYYYNEKVHRWIQGEKILSLITNVKGLIHQEFNRYVNSIDKKGEKEDNIKTTQDLWKKLQVSLQTTQFVKCGIMPLLARKLEEYWDTIVSGTNEQVSFQSKLDSNVHLLGFLNGVYDFNDCIFRNGTPHDFISMSTFTNYKDYNEYETRDQEDLDEFLSMIFTDSSHKRYLLQRLAHSLNGTNKSQKFFIMTGYGANGKSTLVKLLNAGLGMYSGEVNVTLFTHPRPSANAPCPELIDIKGKRFVSTSEPNGRDSFNLGIVKWLSGGDRITAAQKCEKNQSYYLQCTFFLLCNDIPQINASVSDFGTWRRLETIGCNSRFTENEEDYTRLRQNGNECVFMADPNINVKIKKWNEMFIARLIHEYGKIEEGDIVQMPIEFKNMWRQLQNKNDVYSRFIDEFVVIDHKEFKSIRSVFQCFDLWIKQMKLRHSINYDIFEKNMCVLLGSPIINNRISTEKGWNVKMKTLVINSY